MIRKHRLQRNIRYMAAVIAAAMYLTGCGAKSADSGARPSEVAVSEAPQPSDDANSAAASSAEAESEGQAESKGQESNEPDETVDRYEEIIDRSDDQGKFIIYFLDLEVGPDAKDKSGDSAILISPDGKVMLLDAGHPDASDIVVKALTDMGIEKIDYLVASHPHIDHIGGIPAVVSQFPVGTAYQFKEVDQDSQPQDCGSYG